MSMSSAARKLAVSPEVAAPKRPNLTLVPTITNHPSFADALKRGLLAARLHGTASGLRRLAPRRSIQVGDARYTAGALASELDHLGNMVGQLAIDAKTMEKHRVALRLYQDEVAAQVEKVEHYVGEELGLTLEELAAYGDANLPPRR
jgi:hypothetical protein